MQTFLPYPNFIRTAKALDGRRLNNQVNEGLVILKTLTGHSDGWKHHPAVKMWQGYEVALAQYIMAIADECRRRWENEEAWYKRMDTIFTLLPNHRKSDLVPMPPWMGDEAFHRAHRQALLAKMPERYRQFWPHEEAKIDYVWPVSDKVQHGK